MFESCWARTAPFRALGLLLIASCCVLYARGDLPAVALAYEQPAPSPLHQCFLNNGLAYGAFRDGQGPDVKIYPSVAQIEEDLVFLSRLTKRVRTYTSSGSFAAIPAIAEKLGIGTSIGIALGKDSAVNDEEIESALKLARAGLVSELIVGNEVFTGNLLTKDQLIGYLRRVKGEAPPGVLVTTAELAGHWEANPDLLREVDFVVAHFYPFWDGHTIDGAGAGILPRFKSFQQAMRSAAGGRDVRIVIGETGWPSAGAPVNPTAVPSPENQHRFTEDFLRVACDNGIPFYWFSAFDEEWKWLEGTNISGLPRDRTVSGHYIGSSWGVFQSNGRLKPRFAGLLEQPPTGTRRHRDIFVDGQLASFYDIGVDTSGQRRNWVSPVRDSLNLAYPSGQEWGAVFITVGTPVPTPRPWKDFSEFEVLSVELRGEHGGEFVEIGIKDYDDPDDGSERKVTVGPLTMTFNRYDIDVRRFAHSTFVVPSDLGQLYVVAEFVFSGRTPVTVYARNLRYLSND